MPAGVVSHAPGDAAIQQAAAAGLHLDEWQQFVLRESLSVRADGKWAAFSTCLIVPRQNGKGSILEALALAALFQFDVEYTVWTAHQMKTAKQGFQRLWAHVKRTPDLMRLVDRPRFGNDDRGIDLKDGRQIRFIARGGGSGVGFTADLVILDEAYDLNSDAMSDLLPTLSAVPNPQIWYASSAPRATSDQLHSVRKRGMSGDDPRLAFFEWSIDPDAGLGLRSEEAWALANPAYPHRVDREAIENEWNEFNADVDPAAFARERLGVPAELVADQSVIPADTWESLKADKSDIVSGETFALDISPDRKWSSFAVAGRCADGVVQLEVFDRRPNTSWVVDRAVKLWTDHGKPIRLEKGGPAGSFVSLLVERGVQVVEVSTADHARATGQFIDAALSGGLRHLGDSSLRAAVAGATLRHTGDADLWGRRSSKADISPLVAATLALGGVPEPATGAFVSLVLGG